ncbi:MAG: DUF1018 domain-containing protein [Rhizobiales bacterium]|nr:DUF1018 domain-containing protein [Hyphomicrobiales bacterium]
MKTTSAKTSTVRRALTSKVHVAKKALALDDETYRLILDTRYGKRSSADLTDAQLTELVEHFKSLGFKPVKKGNAWRPSARPAGSALHGKIRALWLSLYHLGVISDASEKALTAFAKRVSGGKATGIDALQWLDEGASNKVIEALKSWAQREGGVSWLPYKDRAGNVIGNNDRARVIEAQWRIMHRQGQKFRFVEVLRLTATDADKIIRDQGAQIRKAKAVLL